MNRYCSFFGIETKNITLIEKETYSKLAFDLSATRKSEDKNIFSNTMRDSFEKSFLYDAQSKDILAMSADIESSNKRKTKSKTMIYRYSLKVPILHLEMTKNLSLFHIPLKKG